ncbi:ABC transporter substrate-binding protein [Phytohabitans sp. ZYX-F-186]|uniref:ABC transporter substrate-binding protein n=1 Tax=Phytohabitans maris TaxID=3071409 RepID=A0ABU0ZTM2_9ACTN|nr:ABC transporter substrate-binding protein [Phytohabitans sp. ZYX-F-186]MDQ7909545.1 ABC transporter substrate-binding protein [Phytohabitans sp. ZYX-F-186]
MSAGKLVVGVNPDGAPPLAFLATDDRTLIGSEVDIAQLVADVLGLELVLENTSWENLFLATRSGKYQVGFSNITVTEERKDIYDFATYRVDQLAWEVSKDSKITKISGPADIAGLKLSVSSGTNQEKILLAWDEENKKAGRPAATVSYFESTDYQLALRSGRTDAHFGPNPTVAYHVAVAGETKIVGTYSGGGATVEGRIAAMTVKGSGLVQPVADALNAVIKDGKFAQVLQRWGLANEAVPESLVNPRDCPARTSEHPPSALVEGRRPSRAHRPACSRHRGDQELLSSRRSGALICRCARRA